MHLNTKFRHRTFNRSEVIMRTNKQAPLKTSTSRCYAMPVGNNINVIGAVAFMRVYAGHLVNVYSVVGGYKPSNHWAVSLP